MLKKIVIFLIIISSLYGKMEFAEPKPSFENPRKWLIKLSTDDISIINHTIDSVNNVLKVYPPESLNITIIAYSKGMKVLRKDYDKKTLSRVKSLVAADVELIGCKNTMDTMNWKEDEFIDDITFVQAGVAQVIERVTSGWIDVTAY
jgi:intracellular sulfur oxidation DsrE/DsrF family protein